MSDGPQGEGWWLASDGRWYPPSALRGPYPGAAPPYTGYAPPGWRGSPGWVPPVTSGLAVASLVLSILWLAGLGSLLAVVFALIAMSQIRESNGRTEGQGLAIAGLAIGVVGIFGAIAFFWVAVSLDRAVQQLSRDSTPVVLKVGQSASVGGGGSGLATVSVKSVTYPFSGAGTGAVPRFGDQFAVATVSVCAGAGGLPDGTTSFDWYLAPPSGSYVEPSQPAKSPDLDSGAAVPPGTCVDRYLTFDLPRGSSPASVDYYGGTRPIEWQLSP